MLVDKGAACTSVNVFRNDKYFINFIYSRLAVVCHGKCTFNVINESEAQKTHNLSRGMAEVSF